MAKSSYGNDSKPVAEKKMEKPKKSSGKMTDSQKAELSKHMEKSGLKGSEAKSHRMKMMSRLRRGMSIKDAHRDVMKK